MSGDRDLLLRRRAFWMTCIACLCLAATLSAQNGSVVAEDAWVREPPKSKTETALYKVIENHTPQARAVVSLSTDAAAAAEMHQMTTVKTMMVMTPVAEIAIPAKGKSSLSPNGLHIMLFGLNPPCQHL